MCTLLTHTGIKNKLLDGIPQGDKKIMVSSFAASVQRKQFGTTKISKLLHINFKAAVADVSAPFQAYLWVYLTLDAS